MCEGPLSAQAGPHAGSMPACSPPKHRQTPCGPRGLVTEMTASEHEPHLGCHRLVQSEGLAL